MSKFRRYLNIDKRTLKIIKEIISKGYFKKGFMERFEILKNLNKRLCVIYKIKLCKIKVLPYQAANKSKSREFILIGDQLSLVSFLAKFKNNLDYQRRDIDNGEVEMVRDNLDWALSTLESSNEKIIQKIFNAKEKSIRKKEEEKEWEEGLNHTIQLEGGKK